MTPMSLYLILAPSRTVYFELDAEPRQEKEGPGQLHGQANSGTHKVNGINRTEGTFKSCCRQHAHR